MWKLEPGPKRRDSFGRTFSLNRTERSLESAIRLIPVTRVSNLTPLDRLGLPAFSAVTPLAKDLTTHMGKGPDIQSARISALMEAVERTSAETVSPSLLVDGSYVELAEQAGTHPVNPENFDLPGHAAYDEETQYEWVESHDLVSDEPCLVLADLVVSPPSFGVLSHSDTNGLASGNTILEAVNHAICETIERDAISQVEFSACFGDDEQ